MICQKCNKTFPISMKIDGKMKNLCSRKYCLECSPWGKHNTQNLVNPRPPAKNPSGNHYKDMTTEQKKNFNEKVYQLQKKRRRVMKRELVELKGGCCSSCGYNKNLAALNFHHIDPSTKLFNVCASNLHRGYTREQFLEEVDKCELLCANCHAEHHHPSLNNWDN